MQITFDPKTMDLAESTVVLAMALSPFIRGCRAQGDTQAEVQAGIAELVIGIWNGGLAAEAKAEKGA